MCFSVCIYYKRQSEKPIICKYAIYRGGVHTRLKRFSRQPSPSPCMHTTIKYNVRCLFFLTSQKRNGFLYIHDFISHVYYKPFRKAYMHKAGGVLE